MEMLQCFAKALDRNGFGGRKEPLSLEHDRRVPLGPPPGRVGRSVAFAERMHPSERRAPVLAERFVPVALSEGMAGRSYKGDREKVFAAAVGQQLDQIP
jgi:hypothetical protein